VSNHRSYIDIGLIAAQIPVAFLARQSMRSWPLLGLAAARGNTVFVKRDDRQSRKEAREAVRRMLARGVSFVVFPEGTTSVPPELLPFRPGIFRMAVEGGFGVVPVAVEYRDPDDAWAGANKSFVGHFLRTFGKPEVRARIVFGPVMRGDDPDELRDMTREWIRRTLESPGS
jgi:1-acyl-sn-glycerol-3-phosphate acyltransferase